ncbi:MAG: histidinol-phosphate transaminase [Candidatus Omnitrophota bacterium]
MKNNYKPHLVKLMRLRTSMGRDFDNGICLDRNERVIPFSKDIIDDILNSIPKHAFNAYPDPESFYSALSESFNITKDKFYVTNGITEGIRVVFETLVSPGDKVVTISPTYPMYKVYSDIYQANLCEVKFRDDLTLSFNELYSSIDGNTKVVFLPNPNLPIESVFNIEELKRLAKKCLESGAVFVVDEAYAFFGARSAVPLIEEFDNLVVFQTFSKALGLAGIRLGYMVSNEENIEYLSKTRSLVESNAVSMAIGEYILKHPEITNDYVDSLNQGRKYIKEELSKMGFKYSGGSFTNGMLIFLNSEQETSELIEYLKKRNIYVRGSFGEPIKNCVRLTLGPTQAMEEFATCLKERKKVCAVGG